MRFAVMRWKAEGSVLYAIRAWRVHRCESCTEIKNHGSRSCFWIISLLWNPEVSGENGLWQQQMEEQHDLTLFLKSWSSSRDFFSPGPQKWLSLVSQLCPGWAVCSVQTRFCYWIWKEQQVKLSSCYVAKTRNSSSSSFQSPSVTALGITIISLGS